MAKALSAARWIDRAIIKLGSVKAVAEKLNRSPATIRAIIRGDRKGENLREAARDLAKGKRTFTPPAPVPRRGGRKKAEPGPGTLEERARRSLARVADADRVVVSVTTRSGGGVVLGRRGGIDPEVISRRGIVGWVAGLAEAQSYGGDEDDFVAIEFDDYADWS